jgi:ABC-2 type transport system ATP-binding protein
MDDGLRIDYLFGMNSIMEARGLTKRYGNVLAVDNLNLDIKNGTCLGLLGPNGAGKTTTIEMMEGILRPSEGTVLFQGKPIGAHFKERVGIQFQQTALPEFITVRETLKMFAALYPTQRNLDEVIEICSLADIIKRDNRKLSGGQRQRLLLALALVNDPEIVFLDEPTTGLDPQARRNFWGLIEKIKAEHKTVILTTHYMDEAETICDEIAIMDHGHIIAHDTPAVLLAEHFQGAMIRIPTFGNSQQIPPTARVSGSMLEMQTTDPGTALRELIANGVNLEGLSVAAPNLDDLFLKLTGTSLRN